jgi:hypothetical protein
VVLICSLVGGWGLRIMTRSGMEIQLKSQSIAIKGFDKIKDKCVLTMSYLNTYNDHTVYISRVFHRKC